MPLTNFTDDMLPNLNDVVHFVLKNNYSEFYKNKYKLNDPPNIQSLADLQKLPALTKDEFLAVNLKQRIFTSPDEIKRYSVSSGTTNSNKLSIIPQYGGKLMARESVSKVDYGEQIIEAGLIKRILLLWPVSSSAYLRHMTVNRANVVTVAADIHNLPAASLIVKKINADGLATTATILEFFIPHLKECNFDFKTVKWISLGGEFCSNQKYQYFKQTFPNAFFSFRFGSSEIQGRGYRCKHLADKNPSIFHPTPFALIEINSSSNQDSDQFGEIIHTNLFPRPFPFIRYRTGDVGKLENYNCPCGNKLLLTVGGRAASDVFKIAGVTIHVQAIENSLDSLIEYFEAGFQLHIWEKNIAGKIKPFLELHMKLKEKNTHLAEDPFFNEITVKKISDALQLSAKSNLTKLVEEQIFLPLTIKFVNNIKSDFHKTKRIISHID